MKQIINANVVLFDRILSGGVCAFSESGIEYVGTEPLTDIETVDAEGGYLMPGFVDIHCHGGGGHDFMDANAEQMLEISRFHLSHGTTTLVATTMTDTWEAIESVLDKFDSLSDRLTLHGVHLEGPWLSAGQCGAQDISKMDSPDPKKLSELIARYPFIERISAAPELDKGFAVAKRGRELGAVMSIAHTDADFDTVTAAADNGYTLMTHLYSGMRGVVRENAYRIAGAVEAGLYDDRFFVEVIADGKHLPIGLLKLIYKCKGAERICLVTDAMRGAGLPDGCATMLGRMEDGVACIIEDGVAKLPDRTSFAGSVATTDRLLRTMYFGVGLPLTEISKMLSATPAQVMGYEGIGRIEKGYSSDLVLLDEKMNIKKIFLKGEEK